MAEADPPAPSLRKGKSSSSLKTVIQEQSAAAESPIARAEVPSMPSREPISDNSSHPDLSPQSPTLTVRHAETEKLRPKTALPRTSFSRARASLDGRSIASLKFTPRIPSIMVNDAPPRPSSRMSERSVRWGGRRAQKKPEVPTVPPLPAVEPFRGIRLDIPSGSLEDLTTATMEALQSSTPDQAPNKQAPPEQTPEGSANTTEAKLTVNGSTRSSSTRRIRSANSLRCRPSVTSSRPISADEEILSHKVRLMYEMGDADIDDSEIGQLLNEDQDVLWEEPSSLEDNGDRVSATDNNLLTEPVNAPKSGSRRGSMIQREETELAGGIEDWNNVRNEDVDRYGFIIPRWDTGDGSEPNPPQPLQRVSTSLMLASASPRRKRTLRRTPTATASIRSFSGRSPSRKSTDQPNRPTSSQSSYHPNLTRTASRFRYATNKLPHNKDRKLMDEASDMLTLPASVEREMAHDDTPYARAMKKKEWEREDKWRKMAKLTSKDRDGSGMTFEFDTTSPKLIERTWKGIPDSWRATAWHAFLTASAKKRKDSPTDEELIRRFNELQDEPSPDDLQIDIDVPRTISSHIMFRRRYRGGQRLLFRVLHAMSLYFPETGYVQGMASLVATLLAYYDEENAFVMLVRLWQLRGLERLYRSGFAGLMEALGNFEKEWLDGGEVAEKLTELGIPPTAYGTRWYLTLFNYSIPFPAQLRVWDVFMLLGDSGEGALSRPATSSHSKGGSIGSQQPQADIAAPFGRSLDVLHATSAALIDGMRDIILESDFENAMKVLTSWIPIKDVELFMRVAKAEWKVHYRKKA
ncbi:hypothetical protein D8B26_002974 [Coccidioides posadasii str. Silveira]|uniref:Uncharacterized protein n=2 Tax=Coccidioides posadasii TaxID=199306 RepID=E9CXM0_COCPS|nr:TBC domain containing protein [Coccidioides posadasii C735 delta SOWgp]EER26632.1 TBC domain containing protein [Coccidioides posadasii C735 delta SOWgp]EFW20697.1 hypothetical protein CPSG_02540 [Coccidioides posadasii str. Silveira]QVM08282.1 hypothetical protein D8B26_002974 [Coccidioides posadasii str. Silveira]|eukprot:XP_003068777.1 TBC domain containing protein [Coccidioides posadasii C735 delta SOWgp]